MADRDDIKLDYSNCLNEVLGKHDKEQGIFFEELKTLEDKLVSAHNSVTEKKAGGNLGFMELPYKIPDAKKIKEIARRTCGGYENFVVIGIGGSALGNIALQQSLNHPQWNLLGKKSTGNRVSRKGWLRLFVPDNVDPELIAGLLDAIDLKKTLVNVISKSGTTAECLANFFVIRDKLIKRVGFKKYPKHIIITTDKEKGFLRELVNKGEAIASFEIPRNVGGRFSVLSPVGLVSAAFTGIDIEKLLTGAARMADRCSAAMEPAASRTAGADHSGASSYNNPALVYAAVQWLLYQKGKRINVMMPYSNALYGIADWFRQLWAESLGKKLNNSGEVVNIGPTPVKAVGATDQHSQAQLYIEGPFDKVITFLSSEKYRASVKIPSVKIPTDGKKHYLGGHTLNELIKSEESATRLALTKQGRPNCTIAMKEINEDTVGQLIYMLELATAYAGELFNINAFDQPGVELGKQLTYALLGRPGYEEKKKELEEEMSRQKERHVV
ncbi:MAG: glucose-6-phosphate isomerase [Elusimicrobia bacterium]|nr:glucose-6-phosphate isomerase [Elusimicrobiota bacterium]